MQKCTKQWLNGSDTQTSHLTPLNTTLHKFTSEEQVYPPTYAHACVLQLQWLACRVEYSYILVCIGPAVYPPKDLQQSNANYVFIITCCHCLPKADIRMIWSMEYSKTKASFTWQQTTTARYYINSNKGIHELHPVSHPHTLWLTKHLASRDLKQLIKQCRHCRVRLSKSLFNGLHAHCRTH